MLHFQPVFVDAVNKRRVYLYLSPTKHRCKMLHYSLNGVELARIYSYQGSSPYIITRVLE